MFQVCTVVTEKQLSFYPYSLVGRGKMVAARQTALFCCLNEDEYVGPGGVRIRPKASRKLWGKGNGYGDLGANRSRGCCSISVICFKGE